MSEREERIEDLGQTVSECGGEIEGLRRAVTERSEQIEYLGQAAAERDEQITELGLAVSEREERIEDLDQAVAERDERIEELRRAKATLDKRVEDLGQAAAERNERIEELRRAKATLDKRVEDLEGAGIRRNVASLGFFSICAKNYIPYARTLYRSLREQYHDVSFYLVLADRSDDHLDLGSEEFPILEASSFGIEDLEGMAFRYDVTEFNTAVKPSCFNFLFEKYGHDALVYLDPDVYMINKMQEVEDHLAKGADMVVTPHICFPIDDGDKPNDFTMLRSGIYNLGFLALFNTAQVRNLLRWWTARLKHECRMDPDQGLHVDQKWMDLAPAFVENSVILHHEGYNAAYWNLMHRNIRKTPEGWFANESPLIFFHFSGVESSNSGVLSKHQTRFDSGNIGDLKELLVEYRSRVEEHGLQEFSDLPYAYDYSPDGHRIHFLVRRMYREEVEIAGPQPDPWASAAEFCNAPAPGVAQDRQLSITRLMHRIWRDRADLRHAFDLKSAEGRRGFVEWYLHSAIREVGLDPLFVDDVARKYFAEDVNLQRDLDLRRKVYRWMLTSAAPRLSFAYRKLPARTRNRVKASLLRGSWFTASGDDPKPLPKASSDSAGDEEVVPPPAPSRGPDGKAPGRYGALEPGALLVGYPRAELGMGEHVRLSAKAFATTGVRFGIYDFDFNVAARNEDERFVRYIVENDNYRTNVFHINADQMDVARTMLGSEFFAHRYNIGYWMWELSEFPDAWLPALDMVDEVWAPSRFVQEAISAKARCPVSLMPLAVDMDVPSNITRDDLNLPKDHFLFLFHFDFASRSSRKNPTGVISAFRRNFRGENVKLVLKSMSLPWHEEEVRGLRDVIDGDPRIIYLDRTLSFEENLGLENCCDAFISLHRSEGFGRGMAEIMALGKPVIATNYSGNTDFTLADNSCLVDYQLIPVEPGQYPHGDGQVWAEPDVEQAGWYMKRLVDDPSYRERIGLAAKAFMQENHSPRSIGARYARRLDFLKTV